MRRRSPISFPTLPRRTETRDGFEVVLEHEGEVPELALVDLSHRSKWDLQAVDLDRRRPFGVRMPAEPGRAGLADGVMVLRLNPTQAAVWHLGPAPAPPDPGPAFTEITDGRALVALLGPGVFDLMSRLTRLELRPPESRPPLMVQGPVLDVPCQIVVLDGREDQAAVLLAWARGWGQSIVDEILSRGIGLGLAPGGERLFFAWLERRAAGPTEADET